VSVFSWLYNVWRDYKAKKKREALYARLDRNADGKFSKRQYIENMKTLNKQDRKKK